MCSGPHQNQGWGWRRETGLSPPVKYFTDRSKAVLLLWIFYVFVLSCVCYVLCTSFYMCFVVTCWERADLLALVCGVFCEFVTFPLVSRVRCGTWLYRFLIFAPLLTFTKCERAICRPECFKMILNSERLKTCLFLRFKFPFVCLPWDRLLRLRISERKKTHQNQVI